MVAMLSSTLLALAAAAGVLVVARSAGGRGDEPGTEGEPGLRGYLADVRAGLRTWRSGRRGQAQPVAAAEPVDTTIEDFLAATADQDPAYLGVEDLTQTLARARERAARGVARFPRR